MRAIPLCRDHAGGGRIGGLVLGVGPQVEGGGGGGGGGG